MWLWVRADGPLPPLEYGGWRQGHTLIDWQGWAAAGAAAGALSGLALGLVLLSAAAERKRVLLVAAPWALASAIAWLGPFLVSMPWKPLAEWVADRGNLELFKSLYNLAELFDAGSPQAFMVAGAVAGIIGGLLTGLLLRRWDPRLGPRDVLTIVVGWGVAWGLAWVVPSLFFHSVGLQILFSAIFQDPLIEVLPILMFIAGYGAGQFGGRITLWQVASAQATEPGHD
jgi:hypothetical protein